MPKNEMAMDRWRRAARRVLRSGEASKNLSKAEEGRSDDDK